MRQLVPGAASTADLDMLIRVSGRIKGMCKSLLIAALGAGAFMPFVVAQIRADDIVLVIRKPTAVGAGMRMPLRRIYLIRHIVVKVVLHIAVCAAFGTIALVILVVLVLKRIGMFFIIPGIVTDCADHAVFVGIVDLNGFEGVCNRMHAAADRANHCMPVVTCTGHRVIVRFGIALAACGAGVLMYGIEEVLDYVLMA